MTQTANELVIAQGGLRVPSGAGSGLHAVSDTAGNLSWEAVFPVQTVSVATAAGSTPGVWYTYLVSGTTTLTLPTAVGNTSRYTVKNTGSNTVTLATTSSQTIDGSQPITVPPNTSLDIVSDNANWRLV